MAMTFGALAARLVSQIHGMATDDARMLINRAYLACCEDHSWGHLLKRFTLQTEAQYNTGTVQVSGTTVTGTDTVWDTSWVMSPSNRKMTISGRNEPYDVSTIASATSATIADSWLGSTDAGLSYNMYRDTYALPSDCGVAKLVRIFDPLYLRPLKNFSQTKFLTVRSISPWLCTIPECFTVINQTSETPPRPQIQLFPAPSAAQTYHGWYFRRPSFLTTDAQYPDWPAEFDDMIWTRALVDYYSMPSSYSRKYLAEWKPRYADLYRKMKIAMDGQSAIDFEIEQAMLGRPMGGGANWGPDPTGLSGTGVYGSGWNR